MTSPRSSYLALIAIIYPLWALLYVAVASVAAKQSPINAELAVDAILPFVPWFVWIYVSLYFMPLFLMFVAKDWHRVNVVILSLAIAHIIAYGMYLNFPVLVPKPELDHSFAGQLLSFMYAAGLKPWTNNFPSLHVTFALFVAVGSRRQHLGRMPEILIFTWASLVSISTVMIRQHLVLDVLGAIGLTALCWLPAGILYRRMQLQKLPPLQALGHLARRTGPWFLIGAIVTIMVTVAHWAMLRH